MTVGQKSGAFLNTFGIALLLLLPSIDTVLKYTGIAGLVVYIAAGTAAISFCGRFVVPFAMSKIDNKIAIIVAAATLLVLIAIVTVGYPIANSGVYGGGGDVDDAMIAAARSVIHGEYPYYQRTYLGLLISPLPGSIFLAIPFVVVNALQYQNVFWLAALFAAARKEFNSGAAALGLLWTIILVGPSALHGLVTGSDYITNSIYILIAMWFMVRAISYKDAPVWKKLLPTLLLGVGLSSRTNFILILPLFMSVLVQNAGWKEAVKYVLLALLICGLVTFPFWLYDPTGFAPLISQASKVRELETTLPLAGIIIPVSTLLLSLGLSFRKMEADCAVFFRNCAVVQLFVLLFTSIIFAIQRGQLNFYMSHAGYGMFVLFFAAAGAWITILKRGNSGPVAAELRINP
jgi:hypothetical protein